MPVSELIERDTQAIEASVVSLAPLVAEAEDRVRMKHGQPLSDPKGLEGSSYLI